MISPVVGSIIGRSKFGNRIHPVTGKPAMHYGVDIPAPKGTPIVAPIHGDVVEVDTRGATNRGKYVKLMHKNGYAFLMQHMDTVKVKKGMRVARGTVIGTVGATGNVTGPHLHFEIHDRSRTPIDPERYYRQRKYVLGEKDLRGTTRTVGKLPSGTAIRFRNPVTKRKTHRVKGKIKTPLSASDKTYGYLPDGRRFVLARTT